MSNVRHFMRRYCEVLSAVCDVRYLLFIFFINNPLCDKMRCFYLLYSCSITRYDKPVVCDVRCVMYRFCIIEEEYEICISLKLYTCNSLLLKGNDRLLVFVCTARHGQTIVWGVGVGVCEKACFPIITFVSVDKFFWYIITIIVSSK